MKLAYVRLANHALKDIVDEMLSLMLSTLTPRSQLKGSGRTRASMTDVLLAVYC